MTRSVRGRAPALIVLFALALLAAFVVACKGDAGTEGPQGLAGPAGGTGAAGPKGDPGAAGPVGPKGDTGPAGATGAVGATGPQGVAGATGQIGARGATGPAGAAGGAAGVVFVYDASGAFAVGIVDIKTGKTTVDIGGAGYQPAEKITLTIESGAGSTPISTAAAVEGNVNGAFWVQNVELPSTVKVGDVLTVKATGDKGAVGKGLLIVVNKNTTN